MATVTVAIAEVNRIYS